MRTLLHAALMIILLITGSPRSARADVLTDEDLSIHGFGGWAYGKTDNENRYLVGNEHGSYDYVNFSLNISAALSENLGVHFQTSYNEIFDERDVNLDYAFAELFFNEALIFRVGKIKAAHMLYTEIYNVGTLRPFFTLPQGLYHDFAAESLKGIGFTGTLFSRAGWEFVYDIYGGKVDLLPIRMVLIYEDPTGKQDIYASMFGTLSWTVKDLIGGRLSVVAPLPGLSAGVSAFTGLVDTRIEVLDMIFEEHDEQRYSFYGVFLEYLTDVVSIRSEYLHNHEHTRFETGYGELAVKLTRNWQVALRYEFENEKYDSVSAYDNPYDDYLNTHRDRSFGLNYWFNENFVVKCSYHMVKGNRFANPDELADFVNNALSGDFSDETNLILAGVQFSF